MTARDATLAAIGVIAIAGFLTGYPFVGACAVCALLLAAVCE